MPQEQSDPDTEETRRRGDPRRGGLHRRHVRRLLTARVRAVRTGPSFDPRPGAGGWSPRWRCGPEPFGALAYHFGTRRLLPQDAGAVAVVRRLADQPDVPRRARRAPACPRRARRVPPALGGLAARGMIVAGGRRMTAELHGAPPARPELVDQFEHGLDAPICLTWELTYACNLACVHCLSLVGPPRPARADHRRVQGAHRRVRADADLLRQHRRRRADGAAGLLGAARLRRRPPRRREVLHQRLPDHPRAARRARGDRLRRRADLAGRRDRRGQRRASAAPAPSTPRCGRWTTCRRPACATSRSRWSCTRHNIGQLDEFKAHRRPVRRPAAAHPAAAVRPRRGRVGRAAPAAGAAARALRLADGARRPAC